jgi:hypothetical protein
MGIPLDLPYIPRLLITIQYEPFNPTLPSLRGEATLLQSPSQLPAKERVLARAVDHLVESFCIDTLRLMQWKNEINRI